MRSVVGRLKRRPEFLRVAAVRKKWAAAGLILQAAPAVAMDMKTNGAASLVAPSLRLGFTCSKKVGNAVARNRARRRLRAVAAELMPDLAVPGYDYVLIGRTETIKRPYALLLKDLRLALRKLGVLRPDPGPTARPESGPAALPQAGTAAPVACPPDQHVPS